MCRRCNVCNSKDIEYIGLGKKSFYKVIKSSFPHLRQKWSKLKEKGF